MNHFDEDKLLKYALGLLVDNESFAIVEHLKKCKICSNKYDSIKEKMSLIGSYNPQLNDNYIPMPNVKKNFSVWLKSAAILLIGFLIGYSTSNITKQDQVIIVEQNFIPQNHLANSDEFITCTNIDIYEYN